MLTPSSLLCSSFPFFWPPPVCLFLDLCLVITSSGSASHLDPETSPRDAEHMPCHSPSFWPSAQKPWKQWLWPFPAMSQTPVMIIGSMKESRPGSIFESTSGGDKPLIPMTFALLLSLCFCPYPTWCCYSGRLARSLTLRHPFSMNVSQIPPAWDPVFSLSSSCQPHHVEPIRGLVLWHVGLRLPGEGPCMTSGLPSASPATWGRW